MAIVWGIHRWPVISPQSVSNAEMFPFDDVIKDGWQNIAELYELFRILNSTQLIPHQALIDTRTCVYAPYLFSYQIDMIR